MNDIGHMRNNEAVARIPAGRSGLRPLAGCGVGSVRLAGEWVATGGPAGSVPTPGGCLAASTDDEFKPPSEVRTKFQKWSR